MLGQLDLSSKDGDIANGLNPTIRKRQIIPAITASATKSQWPLGIKARGVKSPTNVQGLADDLLKEPAQ